MSSGEEAAEEAEPVLTLLGGDSRDHHHGLFVAQRLTRATEETAAEARAACLAFRAREGREHFRVEEDVLLPAYARYREPAQEEAVLRVLGRARPPAPADRRPAADAGTSPTELHELGRRLHDHIRHEERVLFAQIEAALGDDELVALAAAVAAAHG
jgi:hypothetical protein